jgi:SAM-dependent methyltransferase
VYRASDDRPRAEGFGREAETYDRVRPGYPSGLIDWLTGDGPGRAVDVGCGTGRVARLLSDVGWDVVGVEPDPRMAAVARRHGIDVDLSGFETWWRDRPEFDLVCSGQAWHWVDPEAGLAKAARLLRSGGRLALFWNGYVYEEPVSDLMQEVFRRHVPDVVAHSVLIGAAGSDHSRRHVEAVENLGHFFGPVEKRVFEHRRSRTVPQWIEEARTTSSIASLGEDVKRRLCVDLFEELTAMTGGEFVVTHPTHVVSTNRT